MVYGPILILFSTFLFRMDCPFRCTRGCLFSSPDVATIFAKLWSKIAQIPKIGRKECVHHFV